MPYNLITILGPTATGKTKLASALAHEFCGEIISADSRQVYKGMDIGTGKDISDYIVNGEKIPYHLIDIISPELEFNLYSFTSKFSEAFGEISKKNKIPFLVGGTGLYLSSVLQNYKMKGADFSEDNLHYLESLKDDELKNLLVKLNPSLHNTTDLINKERIIKAIIVSQAEENRDIYASGDINSLNIGIMPQRSVVKQRITERLKYRLKHGMIEEVDSLLKQGITFEKLNFFGLEYRYIGKYLKGELNYNDMFQKLNSAIHQFSKKQCTWFRKMEREGVKIHWLNSPDYQKAKKIIELNYPHGQ